LRDGTDGTLAHQRPLLCRPILGSHADDRRDLFGMVEERPPGRGLRA
jgi:hypothetical protein